MIKILKSINKIEIKIWNKIIINIRIQIYEITLESIVDIINKIKEIMNIP